MDPDAPAIAATFADRYAAEVARAVLEANGITAVVHTDDAGGLHPHLTLNRGARVVVRSEDLAAARVVLEDPVPQGEN